MAADRWTVYASRSIKLLQRHYHGPHLEARLGVGRRGHCGHRQHRRLLRQVDDQSQLRRLNAILAPVAVAVAVIAGLTAALAKAFDFRLFLQRGFTRQIRALQSRSNVPATSEAELTQLLIAHIFRFFFNPSLSLNKSKVMRFGPKGVILEGGNKNETTWRITGGLFEFMNAKGEINSRFYYSPNDQTFYQVPDVDTIAVSQASIGDQYMMKVALAPSSASASAGKAAHG